MLHGKKGFDRLVYAFKNVLTAPVTWLFTDLGEQSMFTLQYLDIVTGLTPSRTFTGSNSEALSNSGELYTSNFIDSEGGDASAQTSIGSENGR